MALVHGLWPIPVYLNISDNASFFEFHMKLGVNKVNNHLGIWGLSCKNVTFRTFIQNCSLKKGCQKSCKGCKIWLFLLVAKFNKIHIHMQQ